jgi:endonuclease/exonuclease/phosphatase family metal-dependent hydrolase
MTSVTVATINVHQRKDRWRERRHLIVAEILNHLPDLIAFQELSVFYRQGQWLLAQVNARSSGPRREPYRLVQQRRPGDLFTGVAIFSRLPLLSHGGLRLGEGNVALRANVLLPTGRLLDFATARLHAGLALPETREEQAMRLMGWLNATGKAPLQIIAGDFNERPDGPAVQRIRQGYRSAYTLCHGREPVATYPTALVAGDDEARCLDYVFISRGIRASEAQLIFRNASPEDKTLYPSDHIGLLVRLEIDEN